MTLSRLWRRDGQRSGQKLSFLISESKVKVGKTDIFFVLLRNPCLDETILQPDMEPRGSEQTRDGGGGGVSVKRSPCVSGMQNPSGWMKKSPVSSGLVDVTCEKPVIC